MRKIILVLVLVSLIAACAPQEPSSLETVSFKDLMANKEAYFGNYRNGGSSYLAKAFTEGAVIFINEDRNFFAVTYLPIPQVEKEELEENMYMIIKDPSRAEIAIGDIVTVVGNVEDATGKNENGDKVTVYYLDARYGQIQVTGHTDTEDPNFEKLVEIIKHHEVSEAFNFFIFWFVILPALMD